MKPEQCETKNSLTRMLEEARRLYAAAVDDLSRIVEDTPHEEYRRLVGLVKGRQRMEDEAQALLDEHVRIHQC
jgi:hypothetical protein